MKDFSYSIEASLVRRPRYFWCHFFCRVARTKKRIIITHTHKKDRVHSIHIFGCVYIYLHTHTHKQVFVSSREKVGTEKRVITSGSSIRARSYRCLFFFFLPFLFWNMNCDRQQDVQQLCGGWTRRKNALMNSLGGCHGPDPVVVLPCCVMREESRQ